MKKIFILMITLGFAGTSFGQQDAVDAVFQKYAGQDGITTVNITGDMLNMMAKVQEERCDTTLNSSLSEVKILAVEKGCDKPATLDLWSDVYSKLNKSVYKEMISVKQQNENVVILVREANGHIAEILIIADGKDDNALIQIKGDLILNEMADLAGKYQMKGFEQLKKLEN